MPSMNQMGGPATARARLPWKSILNWKMWVISWSISCISSASGRSIGITMRKRAGLENAPIPSSMKLSSTLFCSNAEWVA